MSTTEPTSQFTRRTSLALAATGAVGGAAAMLGGSTAPAAHADPAPAAVTPRPGDTAFVRVSAATAWVEPRHARADVDGPSLTVPVDLDRWNENMLDTDTRVWLTGELETQAVLGSRVIVDEIDGDWAKVVVTHQPSPRDPRGYPGWMPLAQLVVDPKFAYAVETAPTATVVAKRSRLSRTPSGSQPGIPVSFDTVLPVVGGTGKSVKVAVPGAPAQHLPTSDVVVRAPGEAAPTPSIEDVIATGERFLGLRYLWAGVSSWGFDCSGYTFTLFHHHGITIPRDAGPQLNDSGLPKIDRADLRRGDLVFFSSEPGSESIRHVAMYVGNDQIMQSPNASRSVEIMSLTEYDTDGEYAGAVRVLDS